MNKPKEADMRKALPKIKKRINAFLVGEEGKISKQALITTGAFIGAAVFSTIISSKPSVADHSSHDNHGNEHQSHDSHGSHGSHTSW